MASLEINFLDVGQGDGTYIVFPDGSNLLIDLGSKKNKQLIEASVWEFFDKQVKLKKLDRLLLTHGDVDHYNLIEAFVKRYKLDGKIPDIYIGGEASDYKSLDKKFLSKQPKIWTFANSASSGTKAWQTWGGVKIYILSVNYPAQKGKDTNDKSITLLFEYAGNQVILMGDAEAKTEKFILGKYKASFLASDFLKPGHHGSETSSTAPFIKAVFPKHAIISADMHDGYLLPRCSTFTTLRTAGNVKGTSVKHQYLCFDSDPGAINDWTNFNDKDGIYTTLYRLEKKGSTATGFGYRIILELRSDGSWNLSTS